MLKLLAIIAPEPRFGEYPSLLGGQPELAKPDLILANVLPARCLRLITDPAKCADNETDLAKIRALAAYLGRYVLLLRGVLGC